MWGKTIVVHSFPLIYVFNRGKFMLTSLKSWKYIHKMKSSSHLSTFIYNFLYKMYCISWILDGPWNKAVRSRCKHYDKFSDPRRIFSFIALAQNPGTLNPC